MQLRTIAASIAAAFTLTACLGGSGGGSSALTGTLSDSVVKGVSYTASPSGMSGTTGANGEFNYAAGDTVTFKIGAVTLGTVSMSNAALALESGKLMVRPKDLAGVTEESDEKALAVAQLIQTAAGSPAATAASIDVSTNAAKFTTAGTVDGLDKAAQLASGAGMSATALDKVAAHLLTAKAQVTSVEFSATDITNLSDANRTVPYTSSSAKVTYSDGTSKTYPLSYVTLFNNIDTNKTADGSAAAAIHDKNGKLVKDSKGNPFIPQTPDANSLLNVGGNLFLVTHFEYENLDTAGVNQYGKVPMTMTLAKLSQASTDGKMSVSSMSQVDFSSVNGIWIPCAGSRSPWNTHLGSEEYEPDARCESDTAYAAVTGGGCLAAEHTARMNAFRVLYGETNASPYQYGRVPEVTVQSNGNSSVEKWYTLGRISREKTQFFGDARTAIQGDDGTYTMLTMFIADKAKNLSSGSLYAAKWNQTSADGTDGGAATLTWIKLGSGTHADIKKAVDAGVKFSDIFDVDTTGGATPAAGFTRIKHGHETATVEDLKVKSGNFAGVPIATLAAFLETRRYGAMLGATSEFEKMEGVTYNARDSKAYIAMTRISSGMTAKTSDPADHVRLKTNNSGVVYVLNLKSGQTDSTGNAINSQLVPADMTALVIGQDQTADAEGNNSVLDKISNPDNLSFSEHMRVLFIGEDTSRHVNNYLWAYHVDTGKLVRILSLPMGAESTGLQVVDNMNGYSYIMSNYQHAGDKNGTATTTFNRMLPLIESTKAGVGYLGGLPAMR